MSFSVDNIHVETEDDRQALMDYIKGLAVPFFLSIAGGDRRSIAQNKLQRLLCNEIAQQWDGHDPEYVRGYLKLTIGVPILRADSDVFREKYDRLLKPMTFEQKIEIMQEPIDLPVTRIMTKEQLTRYLDIIYKRFTERGFNLTRPDDA